MRKTILLCLTLLLLTGGFAMAQTSTGSITGVVSDETGAVLPGVTITGTRTATGETRTVVTGDNGIFRILNVSPGAYTIRAELTGFKTVVDTGVEVTIGEIVRVDLRMELGEITEEITIESQSELVQKEEGRMSQLVESEEIQDLPLNGRNAYQLAQLGPGVYPTFGRLSQSSGSNAGDTFMVNGQTHRANNYLMDGTDNNYVGIAGTPTVTPQVDMIEEFRVSTNNFSAEYGRNSGAIVNVLTKSGSNDFHGTAYYYHRNDALDAREWFDDEKPPLRQHTYGFTIGGPILKDKLFFFGGWEGFRETSGESAQYTVETQQLVDWVRTNRPGSNADLLFNRFPLTRGTPNTGIDTGTPGVGEGVLDGIPDVARINLFDPTKDESDQWNIRIDSTLGESDKLYGRFTRQTSEGPPAIVRPGVDSVGVVTEQAFTLAETHIFSPTVVNEFRAGWNEREPNFDVQEGTFDVPTIDITGFSPDFGAASNIPQFFARHTYQVSDQLSWAKGDHSLKMGFEYRQGRENSDFQASTRGVYGFPNIFDFVVDDPNTQTNLIDAETGQPIGTPRHFLVNEWALYFQDDFKVTPNFTLNMGVRYENFRPPYEKDGIQSNIVLGPGADIFERYSNSTIEVFSRSQHIYEPDNNNFAPRFGFAWDPTGEGKWAIRGGYGLSYNRIFMNITSNIKFNPPFAKTVTANTANLLPISYTIPTTVDPSFIGADTGKVNPNFLDPDLGTMYVHSIFLGVQRELFTDWLAEVNYVSTLGRKLYQQEHFNRFTGDALEGGTNGYNSFWTQTDDFLCGCTNQNYHAGQFSVTKRFRRGLGFRANYTWSKNIDYDTDVFGATSEPAGSSVIEARYLDRGLSSIHVGNRFAANWVWDIPWFRDSDSWALRNLVGGWQVNGLIALQDGTPATVMNRSSFARDYNRDGLRDDRPNAPSFSASDVDPATARMQSLFLPFSPNSDPRNAFPAPAAGTIGTLGRNTFFYQGFSSVDLSLFKNFKMAWFGAEDATWQFRAEFFNLFNRVNNNAWEENIGSSNFGRTTSVQDAREIQFALKFIF